MSTFLTGKNLAAFHRVIRSIDGLLFFALWISGSIGIFLLKPPLLKDPIALGPHTVSMFIPLISSISFISITMLLEKFKPVHLLFAILLFFLQILCFYDIFNELIIHSWGDDAWRYSVYARNMIKHKTLWGADIIGYVGTGRHYLTQPGYRYYVLLCLLVVGEETRAMQFYNMLIFLSVLCGILYLFYRLKFYSKYSHYWKILALFILFSSPYLAKNVIMCLGEWFVVMLFMLYVIGWYKRWYLVAVLSLALIPFMRQNLLLLSILLMLFILFESKKYHLVVVYLIVLMLPVYHNWYYAQTWRFFVNIDNPPVSFHRGLGMMLQQLIDTITPRALRYLGYEKGAKFTTMIFGILFVPFSVASIGYLVYKLPVRKMIIMGVAIILIVGPILLLGYAYYPRFEFVNLYLIMLLYPVISGLELYQSGGQKTI